MENKEKPKQNREEQDTELVTITRAEYEELKAQVKWLMEQLQLLKKNQFGRSSEKSKEDNEASVEQLSLLFNEAEAAAELPVQDTEEVHIPGHSRKKPRLLEGESYADLPVEVVEHGLEEKERVCPECGAVMREIGKEVRRTLVLIPAQAKIREDWYYTYACAECRDKGTETSIVKTPKEEKVLPGSYASAESIAQIMTQKFLQYEPLYRQEQFWKMYGVDLTRQTMSNWLLKATEHWLEPVYQELHQELLKQEVLHADETELQVLREPGKAASSKSYMWLYRTSGDAKHPIVLYEYKPDRSGRNAVEFLKGFKGYLHTDGYPGYRKLPEEVLLVGCWAHARRKFNEALEVQPADRRLESNAAKGLSYCNKLFELERSWAQESPERRKELRQERARPILNAFFSWAETLHIAPKSTLGRALYYLQAQRSYLERYLEDGRLELSNNRAERSIKPFVMGRKNFLFANTPAGAKGSAVMYSMIQTALENGLDPYRYLIWLLREAPKQAAKNENWTKQFLPQSAPESCRGKRTDAI